MRHYTLNKKCKRIRQWTTMNGLEHTLDWQNSDLNLTGSHVLHGAVTKVKRWEVPDDWQATSVKEHAAQSCKQSATALICHQWCGRCVQSKYSVLQKTQRKIRSCRLSCHHDWSCSTWRLNIRIYCGHTEMEDSIIHACQMSPRGLVRGVDLQHLPESWFLRHGKVAWKGNLCQSWEAAITWTACRKTGRHCHRYASDTTLGSQARGRTGALKEQGQDGQFWAVIAAQCVKPGMQMALALLHMPALENTACYVRKVITVCRKTGARIGIV